MIIVTFFILQIAWGLIADNSSQLQKSPLRDGLNSMDITIRFRCYLWWQLHMLWFPTCGNGCNVVGHIWYVGNQMKHPCLSCAMTAMMSPCHMLQIEVSHRVVKFYSMSLRHLHSNKMWAFCTMTQFQLLRNKWLKRFQDRRSYATLCT